MINEQKELKSKSIILDYKRSGIFIIMLYFK